MAENKKNNKKGQTSTKNSSKTASVNKSTQKTKTNKAKKVNTKNSEKQNLKKDVNEEKVTVVTEDSKKNNKSKQEEKRAKEKKANLKQARRQLYYDNNSEGDEFSKLLKIVLIVTAIIVVFYGITVVVTKKASEAVKEKNSEKAEIQYDSIVIGSMLNINGSFYVLIEDQDDSRLNEYTTMLQTIKANEDAPTIYTADLSSAFNKEYLSDDSNYDSDMEKFKVKGTTLVKIDDHEIEDVYDNYDDIIKELDELD